MAQVKICGITRPEDLSAVAEAGARYAGFVFFPKSPRNLLVDDAAALATEAPSGVARVGLFVNPDDATLDAVLDRVPLDIVQLHGTETPARVAEVKALTGLPVMKALGVYDNLAEDGDVVHVVSGGISVQVPLYNNVQYVMVPVKKGHSAQFTVYGVYDGGGGITLGVVTPWGNLPSPAMEHGQSFNIAIP